MTQTPNAALRLVPVEPTLEMMAAGDAAYENALLNNRRDVIRAFKQRWYAMLAAAPASPLPGGGDWIDGTPEVPVGSPIWCGWASYEIRRLRAAFPAAPTGQPK